MAEAEPMNVDNFPFFKENSKSGKFEVSGQAIMEFTFQSWELSAAFDRCGEICYNKSTKGNTADRRSALRNWFLKK